MHRSPLRQQSEEIRQRMQHVRSRMPRSMDRARADARRLGDWKFYVQRYPWVAAGAVAAIGYLLVPKPARRIRVESRPQPMPNRGNHDWTGRLWHGFTKKGRRDSDDTGEVVAKSSAVGAVTSFLLSSAVRLATAYAGNRLRNYLASRPMPSSMHHPGEPKPRPHKPSQPEQTHDR